MKNSKQTIFHILFIFLFFVFLTINHGLNWFSIKFADVSLDEIRFLIMSNRNSANLEIVNDYLNNLFDYIFPFIVITAVMVMMNIIVKHKVFVKLQKHDKEKKIQICPILIGKKTGVIILLFSFLLVFYNADKKLKIVDYYNAKSNYTLIYDENYIDPNDVEITFPDKKRNLIYIYLESMETTYNKFQYKGKTQTLIPNLEKLSKTGDYFSYNNSFGGTKTVGPSNWTAAAIVAHSAGVPLHVPLGYENLYGDFDSFLPGITSIGDILEKEGYNQVFLAGSDASFGGRKNYFIQHGNFKIFDLKMAKEKLLPEDYFVFWGFEDEKLFSFAKNELLDLAKEEKPFNLTMLTVDTHFMDGYIDDKCTEKYDIAYANAILCSDAKIVDFIEWVRKQNFYKNTTIVLIGDHNTMNSEFIKENFAFKESGDHLSLERNIFNLIINSPIKPIETKNRKTSTFDFFPTTLASMGVKIEGDRLGLGVNLYSSEKTLIEKYGFKNFNEQLSLSSRYYDKFLNNLSH